MSYRVFTKKGCGTCNSVKAILKSRGVDFKEVDVTTEFGLRLASKCGVMSTGTIIDENDRIVPLSEFLGQPAPEFKCATCG